MKSYRVIGINAGNGLCLFPFNNRKAFKIMGNIENRSVFYDKKMDQWQANFGSIPMQKELMGKELERVDVMIGHPDCGDSSILRMSRAKQRGSVKMNESINLYLNGIMMYNPKFWLLENLPGFLDTHSIEDLKKLFPGYHILHWIESVSAWGNSQVSRKRLVIVGVSKKLPKKVLRYFKLPKYPVIGNSETFELGEEEVPQIAHVREPLDKMCNLYYKDQRQISYAKALMVWNYEYKDKSKWHVGGKMNNQPGISRNLPGRPPFTVRKQNRQFGTKGLVLSPREMANIQGAPESFKLIFHEADRIYWINKARLTVTKTMPYEIAYWFMRKVLKAKKYCEEARSAQL